MYRTTLALIAVLLFLPPSANARDQDRAQTDNDPCAIFLNDEGDLTDYEKCKKGQNLGAGIWCEVLTMAPGGGTGAKILKWFAGATVCPDNPIDDAIDRGINAIPCGGGMVRNPSTNRCECPAGQTWTTGQKRCETASTTPRKPSSAELASCYRQGKIWLENEGACRCPAHLKPQGDGCAPMDADPQTCPAGQSKNNQGVCEENCPIGQNRNNDAGTCQDNNGSPMDRAIPAWCHPGSLDPACSRDTVPTPNPPKPTSSKANPANPGGGGGGNQPTPCPAGQVRSQQGVCAVPHPKPTAKPAPPTPCPSGQTRNAQGVCATAPTPCPDGQTRSQQGNCPVPHPKPVAKPHKPTSVKPIPPPCPSGQTRNPQGVCVVPPPPPKLCVGGQILNPRTGNCNCPTGQSWNPATRQCRGPSLCAAPLIYNQQLSRCTCPPGLSWDGTNCLPRRP